MTIEQRNTGIVHVAAQNVLPRLQDKLGFSVHSTYVRVVPVPWAVIGDASNIFIINLVISRFERVLDCTAQSASSCGKVISDLKRPIM